MGGLMGGSIGGGSISKDSSKMEYEAEIEALRKSRMELMAALEAKEKQKNLEFQSMSEKLRNQAEIDRLKMKLELLQIQKDTDQFSKESKYALETRLSEAEHRGMSQEFLNKLRADYETEISKLQREKSELINSYQQKLIHQRFVYKF